MKKRLLSSLLALFLCLGLTVPALADDPFVGTKDGITYKYIVTANKVLNSYKAPDTLFGGMFAGEYSVIVVKEAERNIETANITGSVAIWNSAFSDCRELTSVTIPDTIRAIGSGVFYGCSKLSALSIPASVEFIDYSIAQGCSSMTKIEVAEDNEHYCSVDGVLFSKDMTELLAYPAAKSGSTYTVPDTVVDIYPYAFAYCKNLASVTIPASVMKSGDGLFNNCDSITIRGEEGSYAQSYAQENGINFVSSADPGPVEPEDPNPPVDPDPPVDPEPPVEPDPPVEPPVDPDPPVDPNPPVEPDPPVIPPVYPSYPSNPVSPSKPSKPSKPAEENKEPETSEEPEEFAEPETPVQPEEPEEPAAPAPVYDDVAPEAWYNEAAAYVASKGLMTGTSKNNFSPNEQMTRAMVWTVLGRMAGADVAGSGSEWYAKAQAWAAASGVSDGANPNGGVTRQELAVMLWRSAGSPEGTAEMSAFSDGGEVAEWASAAMRWAVANGVLNGDNGALKPSAPASRAEVAAMLMRFCEKMGL